MVAGWCRFRESERSLFPTTDRRLHTIYWQAIKPSEVAGENAGALPKNTAH